MQVISEREQIVTVVMVFRVCPKKIARANRQTAREVTMSNRLFITGDIHGEIDADSLSAKNWPESKRLKNGDIVVICGDFGLVWADPNPHGCEWWLKWLAEKPWTTVFVDGNHENFDVLDAMPVEVWSGGDVHVVRRNKRGEPKVIHLMRGQIFDLNGWSAFTLGGAASHDMEYRTPRISWWDQEMPTPEEIEAANKALDEANWKVDLAITHCAPTRYQSRMHMAFEPDRLTDDLQHIADRLDYKLWAFGHYHMDRTMGNELCSYNAIWEVLREPAVGEDEYCVELPSGIYLRKSN